MENTLASDIIKGPDWNGVRPIYKKLSEEFHVLTGAYNLDLNQNQKTRLDYLIVVIDEVDAFVDALPEKKQRDDTTRFLINFLQNKHIVWDPTIPNSSLGIKMENLKAIVHQEEIVDEFVSAAEAIFYNTEIKRHTKDIQKLLEYIMLEGKATAQLPLSMLKVDPDHEFSIFFTQLCTLMGIADLVVDAREDYNKNYIVIKPSWSLYYHLNKIMLVEGIKILWNFPKKLSFMIYCLKFTWVLFTEDE